MKRKAISIYFLANLTIFKLICFFLNIIFDIFFTKTSWLNCLLCHLLGRLSKNVFIGNHVVLISHSLIEALSYLGRKLIFLKLLLGIIILLFFIGNLSSICSEFWNEWFLASSFFFVSCWLVLRLKTSFRVSPRDLHGGLAMPYTNEEEKHYLSTELGERVVSSWLLLSISI